MDSVDERRDTALHEARMPWPPISAASRFDGSRFKPMPPCWGSCAHGTLVQSDIEWDISDRNRLRAERHAMIALAGPAASRHALILASRLDAYDHSQHSSDYRAAINVLGYFADAEVLKAYLHYMEARVLALVRSEWRIIEAVADVLIARTTLTGRDVKRVIGDFVG